MKNLTFFLSNVLISPGLASKAGATGAPADNYVATEASWHRRERRQRQAARGVLAVARAARLLQQHHGGGGMPDTGGRGRSNGFGGASPLLQGSRQPLWK